MSFVRAVVMFKHVKTLNLNVVNKRISVNYPDFSIFRKILHVKFENFYISKNKIQLFIYIFIWIY